jgi:hypothetical protein
MDRREYIRQTAAILGLSLTGISASEILTSCQKASNLDWKPLFFTPVQAEIIAEIAETILPETATPGAKSLAVPQFIDVIIAKTMSKDAQMTFLEELKTFDDVAKERAGKKFLAMSVEERQQYLTELDKEKPRSGMSMWGINLEPDAPKPSFFKKIKGMVLWGYYTSKEVGKNIFRYDPIPGIYEPCIPLEGKNAWSGD